MVSLHWSRSGNTESVGHSGGEAAVWCGLRLAGAPPRPGLSLAAVWTLGRHWVSALPTFLLNYSQRDFGFCFHTDHFSTQERSWLTWHLTAAQLTCPGSFLWNCLDSRLQLFSEDGALPLLLSSDVHVLGFLPFPSAPVRASSPGLMDM